eukprot:12907599-Prorocentrum_lima.AAC.1
MSDFHHATVAADVQWRSPTTQSHTLLRKWLPVANVLRTSAIPSSPYCANNLEACCGVRFSPAQHCACRPKMIHLAAAPRMFQM